MKSCLKGSSAFLVVAILASLLTANADLDWSSGDLAGFGFSGNEYIQMYWDVDGDTVLSSLSVFDDGTIGASGNGNDDQLISGYDTITATKGAIVQFSTLIPNGWQNTYGAEDVYTIGFNGSTIGGSTQARVFESSPTTLGTVDPNIYFPPDPQNDWQNLQAIPEPTTLAFLGFAGMIFAMRRRLQRS